MESMVVIPGDPGRMSDIVGARRNLHHSGTTAGTSLQEVSKSNLQNVPLIATHDKHSLLGAARVKDDSRSSSTARGSMLLFGVLLNVSH